MNAIERLWYDHSLPAAIGRLALVPPSALYGAIMRARGALYERGTLTVHALPLPVLSIGNVSVGGTGKTPLAAWTATRLITLGARPAIVMRGYGGDETLVHAALNPGVPVIADADRVRGAARARASGCDCVVLDDGFQHRRLARTADWVLISAEQFVRSRRVLPAGPLREPLSALTRAHLIIVTRKSATLATAESVAERILAVAPGVDTAVCRLAPTGLVAAGDGARSSLDTLRGARVMALAAIGDPAAFFAQLQGLGAEELRTVAFPDHHAFTARDVERVIASAAGCDAAVCTLKDAVKLAPLWPHLALPLLYVSQQAEIERGGMALDASLAGIVAARANISSTAGTAG